RRAGRGCSRCTRMSATLSSLASRRAPARSARKGGARTASLRPQECEVAALVGAKNFLRVEFGIATRRFLRRGLLRGGALVQFGDVDQKVDPALLHRQPDAVAA